MTKVFLTFTIQKALCFALAVCACLFVATGCSATGTAESSASSVVEQSSSTAEGGEQEANSAASPEVSSGQSTSNASSDETTSTAPSDETTSTAPEVLTVPILEINKHGNVLLDTTFDELKSADIEAGDIITVTVGENSYDFPVGTSYTDVNSGEMLCRLDLEDKEVGLATNSGAFAEETGLAVKRTIKEESGYAWDAQVSEVQLVLKDKGGYFDEYSVRNLERSNDRADYSDLSDEDFANFRAITVTGMKDGVLYRSSSPVEPVIARNEYAMAAMEAAGIRTVINLDDSLESMQEHESFADSYYSTCAIFNPNMSIVYEGPEFAEDVKECVLFMLENDGPYLIHCKEGKDRTGVLCAILECFAGASADEVAQDYMVTYTNYFKLAPDNLAYDIILENNLVKTLCAMFEIDTLDGADLTEEAAQYLLAAGLTEDQLAALSEKLIAA